MTKQKTNHSIAKQGNNEILQISHEIDDNLLPSSQEMAKYQELDKSFFDWMKSRCDKEQNARIEFNKQKLEIITTENNRKFWVEICSISFSALTLLTCVLLAYFLILGNHIIFGALFGTGSISLIYYGIKTIQLKNNSKF